MSIYDQQTGKLLIEFDTYIENTYHNSNNVAFEPLEDGTFSSDSKQNTPYAISLTAIKNIDPGINNPLAPIKITVDQVKQTLEDLASSATLVLVILQPFINNKSINSQYYQYGKIYQNLTLFSLDYQNTPEQLEFRPSMLFQQIRLTDTEYTQTQNTANPENSATVNQGQVQPSTTNNTALKSLTDFLFGP